MVRIPVWVKFFYPPVVREQFFRHKSVCVHAFNVGLVFIANGQPFGAGATNFALKKHSFDLSLYQPSISFVTTLFENFMPFSSLLTIT